MFLVSRVRYCLFISCFGKAFETAATSTSSVILAEYFDAHSKYVTLIHLMKVGLKCRLAHLVDTDHISFFAVIELKNEHKSKFFDSLIGVLE